MTMVRQRAFFRKRVLKACAEGMGISEAAIKYRISRTSIYRWLVKYDGTIESLFERSHRPHYHPSQQTEEELKQIKRVWNYNKGLGLWCACIWYWRINTVIRAVFVHFIGR